MSVHKTLVGAVAQLGERGLCKPEVVGSIPIGSTRAFRVLTSLVFENYIRKEISAAHTRLTSLFYGAKL
jgi:hypothetical protein